MSRRLPLLLLVLPAFLVAAPPARAGALGPEPRLVIALDAGHGGEHAGAVGPDGVLEKDIAQAVVERVTARLVARGHEVVLVRAGDRRVELDERVRRANGAQADLFVSVHCNSVGRRLRRDVRGVETYFLSAEATDEAARRLAEIENQGLEAHAESESDDPLAAILRDLTVTAAHADAARLAGTVHRALIDRTGWPDRGVRQAPFAVLNGAAMPAILVELGFLSHPEEGRLLADPVWQSRLADALADGVRAFGRQVALRDRPVLTASR